jgi:hypothetical protein
MRKIALGLAVLTLSAGAAFAQSDTSFDSLDQDTSGELSFGELKIAFPDITQEAFDAADADKSGGLNSEELDALGKGTSTTGAPTNDASGGANVAPVAGVGATDGEDEEGSPSGGGEAGNDPSGTNSDDGTAAQ